MVIRIMAEFKFRHASFSLACSWPLFSLQAFEGGQGSGRILRILIESE